MGRVEEEGAGRLLHSVSRQRAAASNAAREQKAKEMLAQFHDETKANGEDTTFIESLMRDIKSHVAEHKDELDQMLAANENSIAMEVDGNSKKRTSPGRSNEEEEIEFESSSPASKKSNAGGWFR